ncbi:sodium-dependent transporter [Thalassolituus marinus]|uniref:Transporter n=1 Tax=Thalassolituus marinus TaxID=671053 RepID=A0ABS7ZRZ6_9GAMM|nr:sodium-dependent transporter [Thalassolituus marinus]MCA6064549.1 sodium-dependent transporter [Thalassolituus marinus]
MTAKNQGIHGVWKNRWTFILAATGSAVGLGNIWKFPYITGENGGGAFVLMYLACILVAGIPVMMAEVLLGRRGRMSPIHTMEHETKEQKAPGIFAGLGWMGAVAGFFILSFYSVIAGWTLAYIGKMASGEFTQATADVAEASFSALLADPWMLLGLHTLFMVMTGAVIARGVKHGLEDGVRLLMPALFIMLLVLFGYALTTPGFMQGFNFLFSFDASKLNSDSIVVALGHSFFTLSLGMGAMMAYGAYMPGKASLTSTVVTVAVLDTLVALIAGLIIFPIVFTNNMEPAAGPGLMFQTLPIAFGALPAGSLIGTVFFVLVAIAAWSSAISIAEPAVAWAVEKGIPRGRATFLVCLLAWLVGILTVLSFNVMGDVKFLKGTVFDNLDFLTSNIMMPLGGVAIAVFVGWFMRRKDVAGEVKMKDKRLFRAWRFTLRYISPLAILYIFIKGLG